MQFLLGHMNPLFVNALVVNGESISSEFIIPEEGAIARGQRS